MENICAFEKKLHETWLLNKLELN